MTDVPSRYNEKCPECGTRGYLLLPGYGNCKTCLALRVAFLNEHYTTGISYESDPKTPDQKSE